VTWAPRWNVGDLEGSLMLFFTFSAALVTINHFSWSLTGLKGMRTLAITQDYLENYLKHILERRQKSFLFFKQPIFSIILILEMNQECKFTWLPSQVLLDVSMSNHIIATYCKPGPILGKGIERKKGTSRKCQVTLLTPAPRGLWSSPVLGPSPERAGNTGWQGRGTQCYTHCLCFLLWHSSG
jgi:hypothetical protein